MDTWDTSWIGIYLVVCYFCRLGFFLAYYFALIPIYKHLYVPGFPWRVRLQCFYFSYRCFCFGYLF